MAEIFEDCQNKFDNDKYSFLTLLDQTINLDEIVPVSFVLHFHAATGRPREHQPSPMLKALLLQRIFSIPTDTLLIIFLKFSQKLRDFCGFDVVPDSSKFARFKQDFLPDLHSTFHHMVDLTEPICQKIDLKLAVMTIFDTSGIEAWVTENNPKYANRIIKQLKAFIPLRNKLSLENVDYTLNENGVPCCPHDASLPMKQEGSKSHLRSGIPSMKFVCPKMKWIYDKDSFCIAGRRTQNKQTLHADLLAGITQLVTVMVADKIHQHQYLRSLKPLIA